MWGGGGGVKCHLLALLLGAVAVDGGGREAGARQEVLQRIGAALRLHEHQRQALRSGPRNVTPCYQRWSPKPEHAEGTMPAAAAAAAAATMHGQYSTNRSQSRH